MKTMNVYEKSSLIVACVRSDFKANGSMQLSFLCCSVMSILKIVLYLSVLLCWLIWMSGVQMSRPYEQEQAGRKKSFQHPL